MRTRKERLERLVCGEHCKFFQPWRSPPPCGGYLWFEQRLTDERLLETLERCRGVQPVLPLANDRALLRNLCSDCPHLAHDCAYRNPDHPLPGSPCGALVATQLLIDRRMLSKHDLATPVQVEAASA